MFLTKKLKSVLVLGFCLLAGSVSFGQLEGIGAYLIGNQVEVAVDQERGKEGTATGAGFHFRGGAGTVPCGFVADPGDTGWDPALYDGDFFTPGTPENGWGLEIDGVNYSNNYNVYEVIQDPAFDVTHTVEGECITVEWQGEAAGVIVNLKYHLLESDLFYTTEVTLINNSGADLTDIYWYRNVDPDNNQPIGGTFTTTNTIVSQPEDDCAKSLVSAEQSSPHDSYLGFGALGPDFRVSTGGFSERDGSDIWNGVGGLTGTVGAVEVGDQAISLAYKTDLDDTDTVNFTFAVVLSEDAVEGAFSSLYYIDYSSVGGSGGGVINQCNPIVDTAEVCLSGDGATLTVDGPNADDYDWVWESDPFDPDAPTTGVTIVVSPMETTTYTITGTPISDCLDGEISKSIVVEFTTGPDIEITDPGPQCIEFDITTLEFDDLNGTEDPNIIFLTEFPDSADQVEPEFTGPLMGPDDEVWLLIGDVDGGCFDAVLVEIDFGGLGAAGADSTITLCGEDGVIVDLNDLIEDGANPFGTFDETTFSGQFNEATGELDVSGLGGTYTFTYTVLGTAPCPDDEATFTVIVNPQPEAAFEYEVDGVSSADGLGSTCIINTVDFVDGSTIPGGGTITSWDWDFGDGSTSTSSDPSHDYTAVGTYTITLTVSTDEGCESTFEREIIIYEEPILDVIFNEPSCFGFSDGSITAFVAGGSGTFDIEIKDEDGNVLNAEGSNTANTLPAGTYTITVVDGSGCNAEGTLVINEPPALDAFYRVVPPLCFGDSGYVVIDSVVGEAINNPISYFWNPETDVPNGFDADSVNIPAGEYVLTINDSRGCSNVIDITMTEPDELVFAELGFDPAHCRLFNYQNGNGRVFAAATGGTGDYDYQWTYLEDGSTTINSTWGGRNPGTYEIQVTDDNGCLLIETIEVDSVSPIASFNVISDDLNSDCKGTADVEVEFENTSQYFSNQLDPGADTTFLWNLNEGTAGYSITHDFNFRPDTMYTAQGATYTVDVCLIALNSNGCADTTCKELTIFEPIVFPVVNIFTPNGDGANDIFTFSEYAASISEFYCVIVNRWGVKVGEITDISGGWDGTDMNGDPCPDGVYFYSYEWTADDGTQDAGQGNCHIVTGQ